MGEESFTIWWCPEPDCGGWVPAHFGEAVGFWHNHDGRRVEPERVEVVPKARLAEVERERDDYREAADRLSELAQALATYMNDREGWYRAKTALAHYHERRERDG